MSTQCIPSFVATSADLLRGKELSRCCGDQLSLKNGRRTSAVTSSKYIGPACHLTGPCFSPQMALPVALYLVSTHGNKRAPFPLEHAHKYEAHAVSVFQIAYQKLSGNLHLMLQPC